LITKRDHAARALKDSQTKLATAVEQQQQLEAQAEEAKAKALQFCPERVEVDRPAASIDKEITQLTKRIEKEKQGYGNYVVN
jgi:FKBP-type peptidyl-prolyl cis-trans isomerase (trigger factor)